jgi:hypothetical protein
VACTGAFFNNGVYCIDATLIPNYNITNSSCLTGSELQADPYYGMYVTCTCTLGSYYTNGTACIACDGTAPGGNASCTGCLAANGYFASNLGCIYCPNLLGSTGVADPNGNGCGCITNYYWNAATSTCDCDFWNNLVGGPISYCINCSQMIGTTNIASSDGCGCINGYWNALTFECTINCDNSKDIVINTACFSCNGVQFSTGPSNDNSACVCIAPY